MTDHVQETIVLVQRQVQDLERELGEKKRMVNNLCGLISQPPMYPDAEQPTSDSVAIRSDEFYGQPLSTVVRLVLEKRQAANLGAATVSEIYAAMEQGGYDFGKTEEANAKRNLRISLTKNSSVFHRLPKNRYGLLSWYPNVKQPKNGDDDDAAGRDKMKEEFGDEETAESAKEAK